MNSQGCQRGQCPLGIFFQKEPNPFFDVRPLFRVKGHKSSRTLFLERITFHAKVKNRFELSLVKS